MQTSMSQELELIKWLPSSKKLRNLVTNLSEEIKIEVLMLLSNWFHPQDIVHFIKVEFAVLELIWDDEELKEIYNNFKWTPVMCYQVLQWYIRLREIKEKYPDKKWWLLNLNINLDKLRQNPNYKSVYLEVTSIEDKLRIRQAIINDPLINDIAMHSMAQTCWFNPPRNPRKVS